MSMECKVLINWNFYFEDPRLQVSFYDSFAEFIRSKRKKLRIPPEHVAYLVGNKLDEDGTTYSKRVVRTVQVVYIKKVGGKKYTKKTGLSERSVNRVKNFYCVKTRDKKKYYLKLRDLLPEVIYRVKYINMVNN